jgi:hypothetical protein
MLEDITFLLGDVPFRPFHIIMTDDKDYRVDSPNQVSVPDHGKSIHLTRKEGHVVYLALRHVLRIEVAEHHR